MDEYQQPIVKVLGTAAIHVPAGEGRVVVPVSARKEREVLALLALKARKVVSVDQLIEALWGGDPPRAVATTLQGYIAHIRRGLEPHRAPRAAAQVLRTTAGGYLLDLPDTHVDAYDFSRRVSGALARWSHVVKPPWPKLDAQGPDDPWHTITDVESALALWRGVAYADLWNEPTVEAERARLNELHLSAVELVAGLHVALDQSALAVATLGQLVAEYPLRENLSVLMGLAQARAGRQSDALATLQRLAESLREELGLDLSPPAQQLREAILRQDPQLGLGAPIIPAEAPDHDGGPVVATNGIVGRDHELSRISSALDRVAEGNGAVIILSGELGAGKTRLATEVVRMARQRAMTVVRVRVPEVPATPPLWPVHQLVEKLSVHLGNRALQPPPSPLTEDQLFYYLREVLAAVREVSARAPLMIKVTDLQSCDLDTLRALRALVDVTATMRLALVLSRRPGPAPFGGRSGLGAALARAGAVHVDLTGLRTRDVIRLVKLSAGLDLTGREGEELRRRTDGNPYLVIELARTGNPLAEELPATVLAVLEAELATLPAGVHEVLQVAAVIGVSFELAVLEAITGLGHQELTDLLEEARVSMLLERADQGYRFRRRVVREVLVRTCPSAQRAQVHAEIASYLEQRDLLGEEPEVTVVAWHWRQAGAAHSGRAWRATQQAARETATLWAREDAADLYLLAAEVQRKDRSVTARERSELLVELARAQHAAGRLPAAHHALLRAAVFAEEAQDVGLLTEIVGEAITGQYWAQDAGMTLAGAWDGIWSRFLKVLPPEDSVVRCRTLMVWAIESCAVVALEKVEQASLAALAMAERLDDARLLDECLRGGLQALRHPRKATYRLELAQRLIDHSLAEGDARSVAQAEGIRAGVLAECGDFGQLVEALPAALSSTERFRLHNMGVALGLLQASWSGLLGDDQAAAAMLRQATEEMQMWSLVQFASTVELTRMLTRYWATGQCPQPAATLPQHTRVLASMLHATLTGRRMAAHAPGRVGDARAVPWVVGGDDHRSLFMTCLTVELAARTGDTEVVVAALRWLEDYSGRMCTLGPMCLLAPVDGFLALAYASLDDPRAEEFAARTLAQAQRWGMVRVTRWLEAELAAPAAGSPLPSGETLPSGNPLPSGEAVPSGLFRLPRTKKSG